MTGTVTYTQIHKLVNAMMFNNHHHHLDMAEIESLADHEYSMFLAYGDTLTDSKQCQLEREAISCGRTKLHDSLKQLSEKSYSSASVYGTASITSALPLVIKYIDDTRLKLQEGRSGRFYKAFHVYLDDL